MSRSTGRTHSKPHVNRQQSISRGEITRPPERPRDALIALTRQIPWAISSVVVMIVIAFVTGSLKRLPSDAMINRWGIGVRALMHGKLWTIVTSNFLIDHPAAIISTVVLAIVATGVCELRFGTVRTAFAWFLGTWAPLILAAILLIPTHLLHAQGATDRLMISEVGSSTATWCCAGAIVGFPWLVRDWRRVVGIAAVGLLIAILYVHRTFTSIEHFTAIFSGMALHHAWKDRPSRLGTITRDTGARLMAIICGAVFLIELSLTGLTAVTFALLPIGVLLILGSVLLDKNADLPLAVFVAGGGLLANVLVPNAATILAVGAALWLFLYRGSWTLPETVDTAGIDQAP